MWWVSRQVVCFWKSHRMENLFRSCVAHVAVLTSACSVVVLPLSVLWLFSSDWRYGISCLVQVQKSSALCHTHVLSLISWVTGPTFSMQSAWPEKNISLAMVTADEADMFVVQKNKYNQGGLKDNQTFSRAKTRASCLSVNGQTSSHRGSNGLTKISKLCWDWQQRHKDGARTGSLPHVKKTVACVNKCTSHVIFHALCTWSRCASHIAGSKQCRLGLFPDTDFAWDLENSKSTSSGTLCIFGRHTFVPISWMCEKQTSVSHSSTESEIIFLDAGLRVDGVLALDIWDLIVTILHGNTHQNDQVWGDP